MERESVLHSEPAGRGRRLMVVDAVEESRARLEAYFRGCGWQVVSAADGVSALALGLGRMVDAAVVSASLPGLEGYEAAVLLRRLSPGIRVVLTLDARTEGPGERQHRERFRCFSLPVDLDSLARALDEPSVPEETP